MTDDTSKPANEAAKPSAAPVIAAKPTTPTTVRPGLAPGATPAGGTTPRPSAPPAAPATAPVVDDANAGRRALLALVAVLVIVLVVGGIYLWQQASDASGQLAQLQTKLDALTQREATLEARPPPPPPPPPAPPNLQPLEQRLTALENKPAPTAQLDQAGRQLVASLAGRIDSIDARQTLLGTLEQTDFGKASQQLKDGLAGLASKQAADIAAVTSQEAADIAKVTTHEASDAGKFTDVVAAINTRLDAAAKAAGEIAALDTRQGRLAQLQAAAGALSAGRPLGVIAGAPPALAQFATKAPPTEADLLLSFDQAAAATRKAGQPYADNQPFASRVWDRLQSGLVVREGDRVIVGDAVSGVLEHSKRQLDAGDLPGAIAALDGLAGPAKQAMAPWRAQAQSLVDARAALITAARG